VCHARDRVDTQRCTGPIRPDCSHPPLQFAAVHVPVTDGPQIQTYDGKPNLGRGQDRAEGGRFVDHQVRSQRTQESDQIRRRAARQSIGEEFGVEPPGLVPRGPRWWRTRRDDLRRARRRLATAWGTCGRSRIVLPRRHASALDSLPTEDRDQFTTDCAAEWINIKDRAAEVETGGLPTGRAATERPAVVTAYASRRSRYASRPEVPSAACRRRPPRRRR
jgi:hypothetical protein